MLKLIRGMRNLSDQFPACAVTIGNFDGVHLGHQALLKQLTQTADQLKIPSLVINFEPQPNEFFANGKTPPRLMRLREKLMALQKFNLDYVLCLRFNRALSSLSAEDFVKKILVDKLHVRYALVGDDFRFGYKRLGDVDLLKQCGQQMGFQAESMDTHSLEGLRISSTRIRQALEKGDLKTAELLLGRHYGIAGRVAHGDKRGRIIGFPTANIFLHRKSVPVSGVYAVKTSGLESKPVLGVANVGNRPTVDGTRSLLEVHLFNFNREIYGQHIYVEFIHKLRDEKRFESFELLKQQIMKDAEAAKNYFNKDQSLLFKY